MAAICPTWGCLKKRAGRNREVSLSRQRAKLGVPSTLSAEACLVVGGGWWDDQNAQSVVNAPPI